MKKKVLTFYGFLIGMTIVLIIFQFLRYGSITGYLNSGGSVSGEDVKLTNGQGFALSLIEPSKMSISSGSGKVGFLKVMNSGTAALDECSMQGAGKFGDWIRYEQKVTLKPGESALYGFNVRIPSEAESGEYSIPFTFLCKDYEKKGIIDVEIERKDKTDNSFPVTSSLTGFSTFNTGGSGSALISFVLISVLIVLFIGIYMHRKHRRAEKISQIEGHGRKFIKLNLNS